MIPLLVGVAARGLAGRAGAGALGQNVAGVAGHFGAGALQRGAQNRQQGQQRRHDSGISQQIRENPGEAAVGYGLMLARGGTMRDAAAAQTNSLLQSTQFGAGA